MKKGIVLSAAGTNDYDCMKNNRSDYVTSEQKKISKKKSFKHTLIGTCLTGTITAYGLPDLDLGALLSTLRLFSAILTRSRLLLLPWPLTSEKLDRSDV